MDFEKVQAEWVLDRFPWDQLPEVAAQAMMHGFEGPFVLDLVGYAAPSLHLLKREVVEGAFREMGCPPVSRLQAAVCLARRVAGRILRNQVGPLDGARQINDLRRMVDDGDADRPLWEFYEALHALEDRPDALKECELMVIERAWTLLEEGPAS